MKKRTLIINYIVLGLLFIVNIMAIIFYVTPVDTDRVFEENILKVVEIKSSSDEEVWGYATGFFIDGNGTILTNRHVVRDLTSNVNYGVIKVRTATEEEWIDATILKVSEKDDLALIKIERENTKYFVFDENVLNGETIFTIGNPSGFGLSFATGVVSSNRRGIVYNGQEIETMQTSLVINEGNSGGSVFNLSGKALGIISFRLKDRNNDVIQGVSFALRASTINNFLKD